MDKVSVIVPVFNIEKYLSECLSSITKQTFDDIEVVIIDDGSTDSSGSICDNYALNDSRIKVIHKRNEGLVRARKTGLQVATGNYIAYVDGDDWIEPNMIERLYNILTDNGVDIAMCGRFEEIGDTHRPVYHGIAEGRYNKRELLDKVYPNMIVNGAFFEWGLFPGVWDKLFKREALEKFQMDVDDRITMGEDAACTYPALLNASSIYVLCECLYHYRQSSDSMVKQSVDYEVQRQRFNILFNSVNDLFEKYSSIYDLREQWKEYILFLMVPRADMLYQGINELNYLFPFRNIKKGSDIIIYGMGTYGQLLFEFVRRTNFCSVIACADRNYAELNKLGLNVISPDDIENYDYDAIVIANSFAKVRNYIYKDLSEKFPKKLLHTIDEELIKDDRTLRAFGLID